MMDHMTPPEGSGDTAGAGSITCRSKNVEAERRRRSNLNHKILELRALVPNITKMSKESTLADAIDYIEDLQDQIEDLQVELSADPPPPLLEKEEEHIWHRRQRRKTAVIDPCSWPAAGCLFTGGGGFNRTRPSSSSSSPTAAAVGCSTTVEDAAGGAWLQQDLMRESLELDAMGKNKFQLKFCCENKAGMFARLVGGIAALGLEVTDVSSIDFSGQLRSYLSIEKRDEQAVVGACELRELLLRIVRQTWKQEGC